MEVSKGVGLDMPSFAKNEFAKRKAIRFSLFLQTLNEAIEYATDLGTSPWEFALRLDQAITLNLNQNDLRWLVKRGWIEHQTGDLLGKNSSVISSDFCTESRFVISTAGLRALTSSTSERTPPGTPSPSFPPTAPRSTVSTSLADEPSEPIVAATPNWDFERRELSIAGNVVKRFRWPAPNQETILSVFAEEGWPARIEDPLPQSNGLDPKRRLGDTIKCLNRNQRVNLIRFRGDGTGEGVLWAPEK